MSIKLRLGNQTEWIPRFILEFVFQCSDKHHAKVQRVEKVKTVVNRERNLGAFYSTTISATKFEKSFVCPYILAEWYVLIQLISSLVSTPFTVCRETFLFLIYLKRIISLSVVLCDKMFKWIIMIKLSQISDSDWIKVFNSVHAREYVGI